MTDSHGNDQQPAGCLDYDIVIVGGGLVGATLALLLAKPELAQPRQTTNSKKPLSIAVIEAGPGPRDSTEPGFDPRVVALTRQSQQTLQQVSAWPAIASQRACAYTDMHVWDADGTGSIHFNSLDVGEPNLGHIVENRIIIASLYQQLASCQQVQCFTQAQVEQLGGSEQRRELILADGRVLRAPLIIAADGARSKLRELAAMPVHQWQYGHKAIVTTVTTEQPHQFTAWQRFLTTGPLAFLPLQSAADGSEPEHTSSIVWSVTDAEADALMALDENEFNRQLGQAFEHTLGQVTHSDQRYCFPLVARHAKHYFRQGLVLVGDAAHSIHPLAGQGVNLGLADAVVLAEEILRACQRGVALNHESLLRRYQRRRKTHNLMALAVMESFKRLFGAEPLPVRLLRNIGLRGVDRFTWLKQHIIKLMLAGDQPTKTHP